MDLSTIEMPRAKARETMLPASAATPSFVPPRELELASLTSHLLLQSDPMPSAFHVAPAGARDHILEHGLVASGPRPRWQKYDVVEQPAGVYFWDSVERALRWASDFFRLVADAEYGLSDIWRVDLEDLEVLVDPVLGNQGARYVVHSIDPSRVSLLLPAHA